MWAISRTSAAQLCGAAAGGRGESAKRRRRLAAALAASALAALAVSQAEAASLDTLVSFTNTNGSGPRADLITDAAGNLLGTTQTGGTTCSLFQCGTVFEVTRSGGAYAGVPTTLFFFDDAHGLSPAAGLLADANGNLLGTTSIRGAYNKGTVFELKKTSAGYDAAPTVLMSFDGDHGAYPYGKLIADAAGNLFGTTLSGGAHGQGTVFELKKTAGGYDTAPTVLFDFDGTHGASPYAGLLADAAGNLLGTTSQGGASNLGTVFELEKDAASATGYASTPTLLVEFDGTDGSVPFAALIADRAGNLFGTTYAGGAGGQGTVFELERTGSAYASAPTILVSFSGGSTDGANPQAALILDDAGNLFGTTNAGGPEFTECTIPGGCGTVFKIKRTGSGYAGAATILIGFMWEDGAYPQAGLLADAGGNLFGTTVAGGLYSHGTVFELTGTGFVAFAGTPGQGACQGDTVSALVGQYRDIHRATVALGFVSVQALQKSIAAYCGG